MVIISKKVNSLIIAMVLLLGGGLFSCQSSLKLTDSQRATLSPQAQQFITSYKYSRLPRFIHLKPKQLAGIAAGPNAADLVTSQKYATQYGITIKRDTLAGVPVYYVTPSGAYNQEAMGVYIHGGGFVLGGAVDYAVVEFVHQLNIPFVCIEYTLAPEAQFPVAVNQCFAVYQQLAKRNADKKLMLAGGSAGGNLVITTILQARDQGIKLPVAAAIYTPLTDATAIGDTYIANDGRDVLAWRGYIERLVTDNLYAAKGTDLKNPLISPIYASYAKGFVPSILITGTRDLFLTNTVRFHQTLKQAGVPTELLVFEGMWHGFNAVPELPEGTQADRKSVV